MFLNYNQNINIFMVDFNLKHIKNWTGMDQRFITVL
jgi:hypothetical protein